MHTGKSAGPREKAGAAPNDTRRRATARTRSRRLANCTCECSTPDCAPASAVARRGGKSTGRGRRRGMSRRRTECTTRCNGPRRLRQTNCTCACDTRGRASAGDLCAPCYAWHCTPASAPGCGRRRGWPAPNGTACGQRINCSLTPKPLPMQGPPRLAVFSDRCAKGQRFLSKHLNLKLNLQTQLHDAGPGIA
jgi:hypothetical protein